MLTTNTGYSSVQKKKTESLLKRLIPLQKKLQKVVQEESYATYHCTLNLPSNKAGIERIKKVAKTYETCDALVVIGIGGSNLGAKAVHEALHGMLWNCQQNRPQVFFADTVDPKSTGDVYQHIESLLYHKKNVLLNIITKSGTTVETLANAQLFVDLLAKSRTDWKKWVVVTTDKDSPLWKVAQKWQSIALEIPKLVGGRFSVFSAAGLFPLAVLGVNINALCIGAERMRNECLGRESLAAQSAAFLYAQKKPLHDTWFFGTDLESVGKWYRQLVAESLGKKGKGITPLVHVGTTDLHSVLQLCLAGPKDKYTTFVTVDKEDEEFNIPSVEGLTSIVPDLSGKSLGAVRSIIAESVMKAYKKRKLPFTHVQLAERNEESIGAFLQLKMLEVMFLGVLLDVNVFNEPNVEEYKNIAREALKNTRT